MSAPDYTFGFDGFIPIGWGKNCVLVRTGIASGEIVDLNAESTRKENDGVGKSPSAAEGQISSRRYYDL